MKESILAQYGLQATVCNWSGVPIAVATNFAFSNDLAYAMAKRHHPLFDVALTTLLKAVPVTLRKGNPKEQHLLALALCYSANLWDFRAPLHCNDEKAEKLLHLVADTIRLAIHSPVMVTRAGKQDQYPRLRIEAGTALGQCINHLKMIKDVLSTKAPMTETERMEWEVELEVELNTILQSGQGYRAIYGKNAVQSLKDAWVRGLVGECDWKLVALCLNPEANPHVNQLQEAIELLQGFYPERDEFERADGLKVIRHLEKLVEAIRREEQDLGFVEIVSVKGAGTSAGLDANYTVRTGVKEVGEAKMINRNIEAEVKAEWAATGKVGYKTIELLLEVKRRQRALEQSQLEAQA